MTDNGKKLITLSVNLKIPGSLKNVYYALFLIASIYNFSLLFPCAIDK